MSKSPTLLTTAAAAARVLALSRRQFDRLVKSGTIPQHAPRQFDLCAVVPAYITYATQGREGVKTMADAKLATERERARALAFSNEITAGRLIYADQAAEVMATLAADLVQMLEAIPGRHAAELAAISEQAVMRAKLQDIVRSTRSSLASRLEALERQ